MTEIIQIDPQTYKDQITRLWWKCFNPEKSIEDVAKWAHVDLDGMEMGFGAIKNDQLIVFIGVTKHMENRIRGADIRFGGIGGVATLPEYRRDRLVRKAFDAFFQYANEHNIVFSALAPFSFPFYEKFGYALAGQEHLYKFPFTDMKKVTGPTDITFREYEPEKDAAAVMDVQRSMARFGSRLFVPQSRLENKDIKHGYVFERGDEIVGSIRLSFKELGDWKSRMTVRYTWFTTDDVLPAIADFVYRYASQTDEVHWAIEPELPLEYFLKNPGHRQRQREGHMMIRVVKFREFCQQVKVPLYASEPVVIKLIDKHCPWNQGTWKLTPVSGRLEIQSSDQEPEITFESVELSHALGGLMTASLLNRMGGLACSPDAAERFTRIFPPNSYFSYAGF